MAVTTTVPLNLTVGPKVGTKARTLQELIALIKANPGELTYGSVGVGSSLHLSGELLQLMLASVEQQRSPVEFDLSDVTELDCSGVQLLLLARNSARASDKELKLVGQSP